MNTKKRVVSAALAAAVGVSLLCGFGFAKKEYVYQQFETAEPVTSVTVQDASADVIIQAADTDHITVRYGTLPGEDPLYDISVQDGRLVVEARDDVDVDTTDDGLALVRVRIEGHNIDPWSGRELTITLPDKPYEQLDATLAVAVSRWKAWMRKTSQPLLPPAKQRCPMSRRNSWSWPAQPARLSCGMHRYRKRRWPRPQARRWSRMWKPMRCR